MSLIASITQLKKGVIKPQMVLSNIPFFHRGEFDERRSARKTYQLRSDFNNFWDWKDEKQTAYINSSLKETLTFYTPDYNGTTNLKGSLMRASKRERSSTKKEKTTSQEETEKDKIHAKNMSEYSSGQSISSEDEDEQNGMIEQLELENKDFIKEIDNMIENGVEDSENKKQSFKDSPPKLPSVQTPRNLLTISPSIQNIEDRDSESRSISRNRSRIADDFDISEDDDYMANERNKIHAISMLKQTMANYIGSKSKKKNKSEVPSKRKTFFHPRSKEPIKVQDDPDFMDVGNAKFGEYGDINSIKKDEAIKIHTPSDSESDEEERKRQVIEDEMAHSKKIHPQSTTLTAIQGSFSTSKNIVMKKKIVKKKKKKISKTPEQQEEENIFNYLSNMALKYLKIEINYKYEYKPAHHFDSILDIKPSAATELEARKRQEKLDKARSTKLKIQYKSDIVVPNKRRRGRRHRHRAPSPTNSPPHSPHSSDQSQSSRSPNSSFSSLSPSTSFATSSFTSPSFGPSYTGSPSLSNPSLGVTPIQALDRAPTTAQSSIIRIASSLNLKPFPIKASKRAASIRQGMGRGSRKSIKNTKNGPQPKKTKKRKIRDIGDENFDNIGTRFEAEFKGNEAELEEGARRKEARDFAYLYEIITEIDMKDKCIGKFNWSGNSVIDKRVFNEKMTNRAILQLNKQVYQIWLSGFMGAFTMFRRYTKDFVESSLIENFLMICVFLNTLTLALDGLVNDEIAGYFTTMNLVFTMVFTFEMIFKILGMGPSEYSADFFNVFDGVVVALSNVELGIKYLSSSEGSNSLSAFRAVRIFRTFRVLRVTRLLRSLRFMKVIIDVVSSTIEQFTYIGLLLFLFIFIFSLLGMQLFGGKYNFLLPGERARQNFDDITSALLTVFQIMTIENWPDILVSAMRSDANSLLSVMYLIAWIFIGNYLFLNLFLAILLDGFDSSGALKLLDEVNNELAEIEKLHEEKSLELQIIKKAKHDLKMKQEEELKGIIFPKAKKGKEDPFMQQLLQVQEEDEEDHFFSSTLTEDDDIVTQYLENKYNIRKEEKNIYEGVYCEKSLLYISKENCIRVLCAKIESHSYFETTIITLIILGSIKLVIETYKDDSWPDCITNLFDYIDIVFNLLFNIEALIKIIRSGFIICEGSYLRDSWSILDFLIVISADFDLIVSGVDLAFVKVLRMLRTLRPLRFISHNKSMKIVVNALLESITALFNVMIVIMMVWIMFAILAMSFMGGKLGYCKLADPNLDYYGINQEQCSLNGGVWTNAYWNFDNILESFVTLFVLSSMEGWPTIMGSALDAGDPIDGPSYNSSMLNSLYFVAFIMVGSLFLMNLFVGVIFFNFAAEQEKEKGARFILLNNDQMKWIMIQDLVQTDTPKFEILQEPSSKWRKCIFTLVNHPLFEGIIMLCIILNIFTMGMAYEGQSESYTSILRYINLMFTSIFVFECILKLIGLGPQYFLITWNNFDFSIVLASIVDFLMDLLGNSFSSALRVGPQIVRVLRVLRVSRLFKLMRAKQLEGINKIIKTLIFSFPSLMNVMLLLFLIYFIFSVLAVFLFTSYAKVDYDLNYNNNIANFNNFHSALLTLFRCSTGEDWPMFMYIYGDADGLYVISRLFFIVYIFLSSFVMLNMFQLVVMQQFEEYYFNTDNPLSLFNDMKEPFMIAWNYLTIKEKGKKIKSAKLVDFFSLLK